MNVVISQQDSSGKLFKQSLVPGTVSPNGRMLLAEEGQVSKHGIWEEIFVSTTSRKFEDIAPTVSPKYPYDIGIYAPGRISLGKIAELWGLHYEEMIEAIKRRGLHLDFGPRTPEEADLELESIRKHMRRKSH